MDELEKLILHQEKQKVTEEDIKKMSERKFTHKNQYLHTVHDLNLGKEVAYAIHSLEDDQSKIKQ